MADLQFDWFGFSCFAYVELDADLQVCSNSKPVKQVSQTVILPLTKRGSVRRPGSHQWGALKDFC